MKWFRVNNWLRVRADTRPLAAGLITGREQGQRTLLAGLGYMSQCKATNTESGAK